MKGRTKVDVIRSILLGRARSMTYEHPSKYISWKQAVYYCNECYGKEDNAIYKIKKDSTQNGFILYTHTRGARN